MQNKLRRPFRFFYRYCPLWLVLLCLFLSPGPALSVPAAFVSLGTYNLENLFDMKPDGTEYPGYRPGSLGWDRQMLECKLEHLVRVIEDLDADILALQEVESREALELLNRNLAEPYPHMAIADKKPTTVKCALLSRCPVAATKEIEVPGEASRNILQARVIVKDLPLLVFVTHWKSKNAPESRRLPYARSLAAALASHERDAEFVIAGDLNSNYNEFQTLAKTPGLNDTGGTTGINHILGTLREGRLVRERDLAGDAACENRLYNLWLELEKKRRWSVRFFGRPGSPDHIIVSSGLYDGKGLSYIDNSFDKFDPDYLFCGGGICRWKRAAKGRGRHLGGGYSDHLPLFAWFGKGEFCFRPSAPYRQKTVPVKDLYASKTGRVRYRLRECGVIYKQDKHVIIKQRRGRAILIYGSHPELAVGRAYHLTVRRLKRYYGNLEITRLQSVESAGKPARWRDMLIDPKDRSLAARELRNEVVQKVRGTYREGWLIYGSGRKIRLYADDKELIPKEGASVVLKQVRIGYHNHPELVLENAAQVKTISRGQGK
ncbi:MAG: endonuclease/exonuclease/phosphatase family protein [Desulfosalsimonadaceae bacterium]